MADVQTTIVETIRGLIERRGDTPPEIGAGSSMTADLDLDSLELAELSATLEEAFGTDPYSEGLVPETVGEVMAFYN